ncbi:hypothetical protein K1719_008053 [Acacia pycnantha]|nr:hypothetical protein K1719_008053 [Acacia pycnantha]
MGLPFGDKGIEVKLFEQNPTFRDFRRAYKNVKYKTLGDTLLEKLDENFEYLFVLFTLGTLSAPSASIYVSDRMLKVVTLTKDALGEFDWSSFILEELSQQIHEFNKDSHKSKGNKRKIVGGCVYFLMLFCLQKFAFGDKVASEHEPAMAYWTDERVKSRAVLEKKAKNACSLANLVLSHQTLHRHRNESCGYHFQVWHVVVRRQASLVPPVMSFCSYAWRIGVSALSAWLDGPQPHVNATT